jgi:hypothetical protein
MRRDLRESAADGGVTPRSGVRQLRRAWVQGVLFYILVVVPMVAGFNDVGPLAPFLGSRDNPSVTTINARTKAPAPISSVEFDRPQHSVAFRLIGLFLLLSIPAQLVFITLRWLFWNPTSRGPTDLRNSS